MKEEFTVEKKIHEILHLLLDQASVRLTELFNRARSKLEVIVTFMAVLELIRLKEIVAMQKRMFEEIVVMRNKENLMANDGSGEKFSTKDFDGEEAIEES
jgi:segregation and condensation protein A